MKPVAILSNLKRLAIVPVLTITVFGCDGEKLTITEAGSGPGISPVIDLDSENPIVADDASESSSTSTTIADDAETGVPVVIGSPTSIAVDSVAIDNDASNGAVATAFLADRTALGPVKIMAVGDSITHGVVGVSSYRRDFTALMQAQSCSFDMVGSQLTSDRSGGDPACVDTTPIGDGWGWDGEKSCLVGSSSTTEVYAGAHEGYSAHRADHFLTGHVSSTGSNPGIRVSMETYTPDVVLLHLGSVDLFNRQGVSDALTDVESVLNAIYETQPETLVLIANVIPWFSQNPYPRIGADVELLGDRINSLVDERHDPFLKLVNVREGFTESMMLNDLIHPNPLGESHIADAFMSVYQSFANCSSL